MMRLIRPLQQGRMLDWQPSSCSPQPNLPRATQGRDDALRSASYAAEMSKDSVKITGMLAGHELRTFRDRRRYQKIHPPISKATKTTAATTIPMAAPYL